MSWSDSDRDKAIAYHLRRARTCGRCGTRPEEWDESVGGHRNAYMGEMDQCRGCEVLEGTQASITPEDGRAVRAVLVRNPHLSGRR